MPLKSKKNKKAIVCRTLANGVHVITEPIASSHTAAIGFWFSCGSRSETAEYRGAAHFCEHMLFLKEVARAVHSTSLCLLTGWAQMQMLLPNTSTYAYTVPFRRFKRKTLWKSYAICAKTRCLKALNWKKSVRLSKAK